MKDTNMPDEEKIKTLPLLALKNSVLFPGLLMPLGVGRKASVAAVESALTTEDKEVIVVAQKDPSVETPGAADLYTIGTRAVIRKSGRPRPDHIDLFVQGIERVVIVKVEENGHLKAKCPPAASARRFQPRAGGLSPFRGRDGVQVRQPHAGPACA